MLSIHSLVLVSAVTVTALWVRPALAADTTETVKGIVSMGPGGFGLILDDGDIIRFLGKSGNTVFTACHKGDICEITGTMAENASFSYFVTITRVRKLGHASAEQIPRKDTGPMLLPAETPPQATAKETPAAKSTEDKGAKTVSTPQQAKPGTDHLPAPVEEERVAPPVPAQDGKTQAVMPPASALDHQAESQDSEKNQDSSTPLLPDDR